MKVKNRNEPKVGLKKPRRTRSERFGERKKAKTIGFVRYDSHTMGCQLTISSLISGAAFNHSRAAITTRVSRRRWRPRRFLRPESRSTSPSLSRRCRAMLTRGPGTSREYRWEAGPDRIGREGGGEGGGGGHKVGPVEEDRRRSREFWERIKIRKQ